MQPRFKLLRNAIFLGFAVGLLAIWFAELRAEAQVENRAIQPLQLIRLRQP